jgi:hypothetical protein
VAEPAEPVEPAEPDWIAAGLQAAGLVEGLVSDLQESGIKLSHHQKDCFHIELTLSLAFGTTNTWSPIFLKCVADVLLVLDPSVKQKVWRYLTRQHEKAGTAPELAKAEAKKQIHSFLRKNPQYMKKGPLPPAQTYLMLCKIERIFAGAECTKKKGPPRKLFTKRGIEAWKDLKKLVLEGHYGQNADLPRYIHVRRCRVTELDIWRCCNSTSWLEARLLWGEFVIKCCYSY